MIGLDVRPLVSFCDHTHYASVIRAAPIEKRVVIELNKLITVGDQKLILFDYILGQECGARRTFRNSRYGDDFKVYIPG
jgi:hypothetical protein